MIMNINYGSPVCEITNQELQNSKWQHIRRKHFFNSPLIKHTLTLRTATWLLQTSTPPTNSAWIPSRKRTCLKSDSLGSFIKTDWCPGTLGKVKGKRITSNKNTRHTVVPSKVRFNTWSLRYFLFFPWRPLTDRIKAVKSHSKLLFWIFSRYFI